MMSLRKRFGASWLICVREDGSLETDAIMCAAMRTQKDPAERRQLDSMRQATNAQRKVRDIERDYAPMIEAIRVDHDGRWCYDLHAAGKEKGETALRTDRKVIAELAVLLDDAWTLHDSPIGRRKEILKGVWKKIARAPRKQSDAAVARKFFPKDMRDSQSLVYRARLLQVSRTRKPAAPQAA